jgi:hypothetical protein
MRRALLVFGQDQFNLGVIEYVVSRQDHPAREPENVLHTLFFKTSDQYLGACKFHDLSFPFNLVLSQPLYFFMKDCRDWFHEFFIF